MCQVGQLELTLRPRFTVIFVFFFVKKCGTRDTTKCERSLSPNRFESRPVPLLNQSGDLFQLAQ
jgi:hypothetical protein